MELANLIKKRFTKTNPYFERLGDSMIVWTDIWDKVSKGDIKPEPSRESDPSVQKKYRPINLHPTSSSVGMLSEEDILNTFPILGKNTNFHVNANDVAVGHRWKTYILPVDKKFHEGVFHSYLEQKGGLDCLTKACDGPTLVRGGKQYTDYMAEIIIFRKLLASLHFVKDIQDADLIFVPVLGSSTYHANLGACKHPQTCHDDWYGELVSFIEKNSDATKKHLFLNSQVSFHVKILHCKSIIYHPVSVLTFLTFQFR